MVRTTSSSSVSNSDFDQPINSDQAHAGRASPAVERTGGTGVAVYHVQVNSGAFSALRVAFSTRAYRW
jgi:hypothetical protein